MPKDGRAAGRLGEANRGHGAAYPLSLQPKVPGERNVAYEKRKKKTSLEKQPFYTITSTLGPFCFRTSAHLVQLFRKKDGRRKGEPDSLKSHGR